MKLLIVDDETLGLARLERMLITLGYSDIVKASDASAALAAIDQERFDVALLDINMPQINGLELAYALRLRQNDIAVIFQTGYDNHAIEAFDLGASGYLVKPFSIESLKNAIDRVANARAVMDTQFRIMSKNGEDYYLLKPEDIYYIKADLAEVMLRTAQGFSYYVQKISDLEKRLLPHQFVRIHRSYLININKIKSITTVEQSRLRFSFTGIKEEVESSKEGAKAFRAQFG
ncbi:MAG: LytR family transcriptional regulator [Sulfuricurvum sp. PC08-66]|nr:MAG: LytR family transcriptional regulator [Sulfuricurvum sp. PC08-66]